MNGFDQYLNEMNAHLIVIDICAKLRFIHREEESVKIVVFFSSPPFVLFTSIYKMNSLNIHFPCRDIKLYHKYNIQ